MDPDAVARVRRFNRAVTQRVGALDDAFLARGRSLGQSRLLWEIGESGAELRELRARLDLDSGYLTRMLQALDAAGLASVGSEPGDARVRVARLTPAGAAERRELDRLSDAQAESMLAPLDATQRARLVEAMGEVERLLAVSAVTVEVVAPSHPDARAAVGHYFAELATRFESGFDAGTTLPLSDESLQLPSGAMLLARLHGEPVAVGGVKLLGDGVGEIKRVWVSPTARGLGLGRRMLTELESVAREHGRSVVRLDTNRALVEAIALYRSAGYHEVTAFNAEPYAHHWFEKEL
ncbi:helix-turn-helix domain-containing GNAT family N-acetyltransferase [Antiquaquibacter soli]|uniref:Helix-turn-helix domain-containing GNAT family N-acetyltransferase n=1 Tax=Antiquaquibacter soli TaxID=3064523 RepID=A0ABT9BL67_9MICO|nr:helix-turn-helix domain-containing GNAT family N-acetyltransferase [Protaetiibacter sp. WY-16]MDO7881183.1 helix-turn-helix domain-containing GNAT family N-acetyltransferase [Protaetiibacter sp. WY-16]